MSYLFDGTKIVQTECNVKRNEFPFIDMVQPVFVHGTKIDIISEL